MNRPTRSTPSGQAYLDLQNRARREKRGTQELLILYVVERWLARLSASRHADQFILKGGMLLAAFDARRPTVDADTLVRNIANDETTILTRVLEISEEPISNDGVVFRTDTARSRTIRDEALYSGVRVTMDAAIATATVKFQLDVNFGDPVSPAPRRLTFPTLLRDAEPINILGYPIETVLAEKLATAIALGDANTRVRDYADIYALIGRHNIAHREMRQALLATARFRGIHIEPVSGAIDALVEIRAHTYRTYRTGLGAAGVHLPDSFAEVIEGVVRFADPLTQPATTNPTWDETTRQWRQ